MRATTLSRPLRAAFLRPVSSFSSTNHARKTAPFLKGYTTTSASTSPKIAYASNTDPIGSAPRVVALLHKDRGQGKDAAALNWVLTPDARGLRRDFKFKTFKTTWAFMNVVAGKCAEEKHHPEWTNIYNRVSITWTTHRPHGLSHKDLTMAEFCDEQAAAHGEANPSPSAEGS